MSRLTIDFTDQLDATRLAFEAGQLRNTRVAVLPNDLPGAMRISRYQWCLHIGVEALFLLHEKEGLRNVDIANKPGIIRQAVGRAMRKLKELGMSWANEAVMHLDTTYESFKQAAWMPRARRANWWRHATAAPRL